ncbi:glycosyltransferase [Bacillus sp. FJAT-29937]|uniref:glycosyltransferase n=1 Tax=Bacillus sp. FJAT-29937 TaxID=1720553 RepID=UPI000AD771B6|nr:glycosyltransferase [Bacillus sp. FJAT-29937]
MKKKKILFIMQSLQGGGAERVTLDVIKHLNKSSFEPSILVVNYYGDLIHSIPESINVIKVLTSKEKSYFHVFKVIRAVIKAAKDADLIIGSLELTPTYLSSIASVITKKPAIGWIHIDLQHYLKTKNKIHELIIRVLYPKLNMIMAVSDGVKHTFEQMFPQITVPVKRIYNPIRLEDIHRMIEEKSDLGEISEPIILGVGRLTKMKGFDDLIKAHQYLINNNVKNKLLILGEGEQRECLEQLIVELDVKDSVILKGFVDNPYKYMRSANVFVLSSRYEGFSVVIAEALSVGIPVVSTDCPSGPSEILEGGKHGLLSPINDSKALAMNIYKTIKEDSENHKVCRVKRAHDFSPQKIIPEYEKLFYQIMAEK